MSLSCVALVVGLAGCSGGQATAKVSGKVVVDGKPVTGGMITFTPIAAGAGATAGKGASGEVKGDGTFALTTTTPDDGAVVGRHKVAFFPPSAPAPEAAAESGKHDQAPAPSPLKGLMPKQAEVEVKAGTNEITIELVPDPKAALIVNPG